MKLDPNAPDVYTDLNLYQPKKEGVYIVVEKSRWNTIPVPQVAFWLQSENSDIGGYFIHPHSRTGISATHWTTIKTKLPI